MNEKDIIKSALDDCGWSQKTLAQKVGYSNQSGVGNHLSKRSSSMKVSDFVKYLSVMGYEVIVKSSSDKKNPIQWKLSYEENEK